MPRIEPDSGYEDPSAENESDAISPLLEGGRQVFISSSDWTTETILSQLRKGNIDLNPRFQRRGAWDRARQSRFIESIILNMPIPQIVLAESVTRSSRFLVLDGKQRLLTIRQFCADVNLEDDEGFEVLQLKDLKLLETLNNQSYTSLAADTDHTPAIDAFDNHTVRTVVIRNWPDADYLHRVFLRLNTGSVSLSPQELRQAFKPGPFMDRLDELAVGSVALQNALGIQKPDFRMRDNEILLRHLAFAFRVTYYRGNLKQFLDDASEFFNSNWPEYEPKVNREAQACEDAICVTQEIFGQHDSFSTYDERGFQGLFNRAVFDIMTYYFRDADLSSGALDAKQAVKQAFIDLSTSSFQFQQSLTATTKSINATALRFVAWAKALGEAIGLEVDAPENFVARLRGDAKKK